MSWEIDERIFEPGGAENRRVRTPKSSLSNLTLSEAHLKLSYLESNHKVAYCDECDQEFPLTPFSSSEDDGGTINFAEYRCPICGGPLVFEG